MWFQDFANSLWLELQLQNKPLPRQKPTAETFSDTPLPAPTLLSLGLKDQSLDNNSVSKMTCNLLHGVSIYIKKNILHSFYL